MGNLLQSLDCNKEARLAKQTLIAKEYCLKGVQASTESMETIQLRLKALKEKHKELVNSINKAVEHARTHPEEAELAEYDGKSLIQEKLEVKEQYRNLNETLRKVRTLNGKLNYCTDTHILRDTMVVSRKALRSLGRDAESTSEDMMDDIADLLNQLSNVNKILSEPSNKDKAIVEDDAVQSEWEEMMHGTRAVSEIAERPSILFAPNQIYGEMEDTEEEEPASAEPIQTPSASVLPTPTRVTKTHTAVLQSEVEPEPLPEPPRAVRQQEKRRLLVPA